ncbi:hypothetical protein GJ496_010365 [Pomphorhynchus laevis]|nr:hypothetical protein GJ496_010365 [Pomphorhynchus laevis]
MSCDIEDIDIRRPSKAIETRLDKQKSSQVMTICLENIASSMQEKYRVFVKTWGCSHNRSDSEIMSGLLESNGYILTEDMQDAHVWLLNSCTAKTPSEDKFIHFINTGLKLQKKIVLAGCVTEVDGESFSNKWNVSIVGVDYIDRVVEVVDEAVQGHTTILIGKRELPSLVIPKVRQNKFIEIISVSSGCLNHCTYCKTKLARGELRSYSIKDIVDRCASVFSCEGVREIWLTSEDLGAYGIDIGTDIIKLIDAILRVTPIGCMIRLGMTNPPYMYTHAQDLVRILSDTRVYSFLHIPVQSGSNSVLADMRREYCIDDFESLVQTVTSAVPGGVHIATDIICGYPTETEQDFQLTMQLIEKYKFPSLYINQFYPRSNTFAALLPQLSTIVKRKRTRHLTKIFKSYQSFDRHLNSIQMCLFTEIAKDGFNLVGHTKRYEQVLCAPGNSKIKLGSWANVRIVKCGKYSMEAVPVKSDHIKVTILKAVSAIALSIVISKISIFIVKNYSG